MRDVICGVSLVLDSGRLVVTGRNGSGKSTLLRIIAGLVTPTAGEVVFTEDGAELSIDARRDALGLVAPDLTLYDELSAIENLRFFCRVRGLRKSDNELKSLLAGLGLRDREDDPIGSYSSGMRQRAKYAFALAHNPEVLLLDEPTANLDQSGIDAVDRVITEHRGIVIIATNEADELRYGDSVLELGA